MVTSKKPVAKKTARSGKAAKSGKKFALGKVLPGAGSLGCRGGAAPSLRHLVVIDVKNNTLVPSKKVSLVLRPADKVWWVALEKFTVTFTRNVPNPDKPEAKCFEAKKLDGLYQLVIPFSKIRKLTELVYEASAGGRVIDPIIIVDPDHHIFLD